MQYDYLLVHGAFSNSGVWQTLAPQLTRAGAKVIALDLPGHTAADSASAGSVTMDDYVARIVRDLDAAPEPVVLVAHSMGGIPASGAAEARPEKVAALVYLCALLPESGESLGEITATDTQARLGPHLEIDAAAGVARCSDAGKREALLNRSDESAAAIVLGYTFPEPIQPFGTGVTLTPERFGAVRRFYITTTDDRGLGTALQKRLYEAQPCERVFSIEADHMPMLSATDAVAKALLEIRAAL
ncbi:MAG: alpha/beta hydrolase [Vulcanimicrobiaceae bacterium]